MGILDLLQQIVHEPAPKLPKSDAFPKILEDFIAKCLLKKPEERPTPRELYDHDLFLKAAKRTPVDLRGWAIEMMNKKNRKSYLNPPAPRSIQDLGKPLPSSTSSASSASASTSSSSSSSSPSSSSSSSSSSHHHTRSTSSTNSASSATAAATAAGSGPSMSSRGPPGMAPQKPTRMPVGGVGSAGGMKTGRASGFTNQAHVQRQTGSAAILMQSQQQKERGREQLAQQHQQQQERQHRDCGMEHYYTASQRQSQGQVPLGQSQPRKMLPSPSP
ncbi:MAP kinase kinase (MEK), partial [Ascosphaera aggregata]